MTHKIISRIAPTPSGFLHAGNVYNFLLTYLFTRSFGGVLHLRIDDYDLVRYRREFVENIFFVLDMLCIDFDFGACSVAEFESKFSSKFRLSEYQKALNALKSTNLCYVCECSYSMKNSFQNGIYRQVCLHKNLNFKRDKNAIRLYVPNDLNINISNKNITQYYQNIFIDDNKLELDYQILKDASYQNKGYLNLNSQTQRNQKSPVLLNLIQSKTLNLARVLGDFVIWKKDDTPSYNLTSIVDDESLGVNLLVRGDDLLGCSAAQKYMADILGFKFENADFIHHSLIMQNDKKLSKSAKSSPVNLKDGAKIHYQFAASNLGLNPAKCTTLSELLDNFKENLSQISTL